MLRSLARFSVLAALAALFVTAAHAPQTAQAQSPQWRQTVEVITPVKEDDVTGALLDTLMHVAQRNSLELLRSPDAESKTSFGALEEELLNQGVDFTSANQMFITYRFEADRRGLETTITDLYFIYRPADATGDTDIPIFKLDATDPVIRKTLVESGMQKRTNEVAFEPFHDQLLFHNLPESQLVALGGDVIRDPDEAEKERQRVLRTVRRFLY